MTPQSRQNGFTLLELMIAMAILGILSSVAFYGYESQSRKGRRVDAIVELEKIAQAQHRFFTQNNTFTTDIDDLVPYGITGSTTNDYYDLSLEAGDGGITVAVEAVATPILTKSQAKDICTELRVLSNGTHEGIPDRATCWGK